MFTFLSNLCFPGNRFQGHSKFGDYPHGNAASSSSSVSEFVQGPHMSHPTADLSTSESLSHTLQDAVSLWNTTPHTHTNYWCSIIYIHDVLYLHLC